MEFGKLTREGEAVYNEKPKLAWEGKSCFTAEYSGLDCCVEKSALLSAAKFCDLCICECTVSSSVGISQTGSLKGINNIFLLEDPDNFVI